MPIIGKHSEKVAKEREIRSQLIQRASAGDEEARDILAAPPYRLRVYTPKERQAYAKDQAET